MNNITQHLGNELSEVLKTADEVWIAVALMTKAGMSFIEEYLPETAIQHYVLGTDLPTEPAALTAFNNKQFVGATTVSMHVAAAFYHPKVYLIRSNNKMIAFVGSANCTKNGLTANIELSFIIRDQKSCKELLNWYKEIEAAALPLSTTFINEYRTSYDDRKQTKRADERIAKALKRQLRQGHAATMHSRAALIKILKRYRKGEDYNGIKADRAHSVIEIRQSLDYPNFRNIDLDDFFGIWDLGHLISIPKPRILAELPRFRQLLQMLTNEDLDIAERYDQALQGDLAMNGVNDALISKVLTIHNPKKYYVKNGKSNTTLRNYGLELPRRISRGQKYKATCNFLIEVAKESGIHDMAVLDYYLYLEAEE